jgi:hypothetical protein
MELDLQDMIFQLEDRIGVLYSKDEGSITGELALMRQLMAPIPFVEIDINISGDNFPVRKTPVMAGDSAIINGHAVITVGNFLGTPIVEAWRDITFVGRIGTIEGANGRYDGKTISLTYFYSMITLYDFIVTDGFISIVEVATMAPNLIIEDAITGNILKITIGWDGAAKYTKTDYGTPLNDTLVDSSTGDTYKIYAEDEKICLKLEN